MFKLALLGRDIGYTRSPKIHEVIATAIGESIEFHVVDVTYDMLESTVGTLLSDFDGFFVTKPYKYDVKKYLDCDISGGINVVRSRDKKVFNTDGDGFIHALDRNFPSWNGDVSSVLVMGAGGAAYSVVSSLVEAGKKVYILNRTLMRAVKLCSLTKAELYVNQPTELAVNCTSLGTAGEDVLHSLCVLPSFKYAFDLVYAQAVTPFMRRAMDAGATVTNGTDMLIYQAIIGDGLLLGKDLNVEEVYNKVREILKDLGE
ncbi:MAG: hypothetical protein J1G01_05935 [Clostridiales bacterium]|nr:hypothetical protein [Clostridiales bacterium]